MNSLSKILFSVIALCVSAIPAIAFDYPVVKITKSVSPLGPDQIALDMLDSVTVTIALTGDTKNYPNGVETAVVLVLDESGSMDGHESYSRGAAKAVIALLKPADKVGLVAFGSGIKAKVALTTDHASVTAKINSLDSPDGQTNALNAINEANAMLTADPTAVKRIVIFFTDGVPTPITQVDDILDKVDDLNQAKISYYTVAYQNFLKNWLKQLAQETGGVFCDAGTGALIESCFIDAFKKGSQTVNAQHVWVHEVLSKNFEAVPGTLNYSMGGSYTPETPSFKAAMQSAAQTLYSTGVLDTPAIYELPASRTFNVQFDITPTTCKDIVQNLGTNDTNATYLEYNFGPMKAFQIYYPEFNQAFVKVNRCGVYLNKTFEQTNRIINIRLSNAFPDRNVCDVHLTEVVGPLVMANVGAATPSTWQGDSRIVFPHYPPGEAWKVNGLEWRLFDGVPLGPNEPPSQFPPHGFKVTSHNYIGPSTEVLFKLPVDARPEAAGQKNVLVNMGWKPSIDGGDETGSTLTFWYKIPFGVPRPKNENVAGYTYNYYYESISGDSKWDFKRHVVIHLPDLKVPSLEPEWPHTKSSQMIYLPGDAKWPGKPTKVDPSKITPKP